MVFATFCVEVMTLLKDWLNWLDNRWILCSIGLFQWTPDNWFICAFILFKMLMQKNIKKHGGLLYIFDEEEQVYISYWFGSNLSNSLVLYHQVKLMASYHKTPVNNPNFYSGAIFPNASMASKYYKVECTNGCRSCMPRAGYKAHQLWWFIMLLLLLHKLCW